MSEGQNAPQADAPKRPLSSYNLYFLLERKRILEGVDGLNLPVSSEDVRAIAAERESKPRRRHRKSHGKISFRDLAKTLAERWKALDADKRKVFEVEAKVLWTEYENKMREWNSRNTPLTQTKPAKKKKKTKQPPAETGARIGTDSCATSVSGLMSGVVRAVSEQGSPLQEIRVVGPSGFGVTHPVVVTPAASTPLQRSGLVSISNHTGDPTYLVGSTNGQSGSDSYEGFGESEASSDEERGRTSQGEALDKAKRIVQQSIHDSTLTPPLRVAPKDLEAAKRKIIAPSQLPKKKQKVQQTLSSSSYRFDLNDPVEVTKNSVHLTVRGRPSIWKPPTAKLQPGGGLALLSTERNELRDVTECLLKFHAGHTPKFETNQVLSATLVFAFPINDERIQQTEGVDLYVKFVLDAYTNLLFDQAGQVVSLQARKKYDIPGGSGYTSVLLEVDSDFRTASGNASGS